MKFTFYQREWQKNSQKVTYFRRFTHFANKQTTKCLNPAADGSFIV